MKCALSILNSVAILCATYCSAGTTKTAGNQIDSDELVFCDPRYIHLETYDGQNIVTVEDAAANHHSVQQSNKPKLIHLQLQRADRCRELLSSWQQQDGSSLRQAVVAVGSSAANDNNEAIIEAHFEDRAAFVLINVKIGDIIVEMKPRRVIPEIPACCRDRDPYDNHGSSSLYYTALIKRVFKLTSTPTSCDDDTVAVSSRDQLETSSKNFLAADYRRAFHPGGAQAVSVDEIASVIDTMDAAMDAINAMRIAQEGVRNSAIFSWTELAEEKNFLNNDHLYLVWDGSHNYESIQAAERSADAAKDAAVGAIGAARRESLIMQNALNDPAKSRAEVLDTMKTTMNAMDNAMYAVDAARRAQKRAMNSAMNSWKNAVEERFKKISSGQMRRNKEAAQKLIYSSETEAKNRRNTANEAVTAAYRKSRATTNMLEELTTKQSSNNNAESATISTWDAMALKKKHMDVNWAVMDSMRENVGRTARDAAAAWKAEYKPIPMAEKIGNAAARNTQWSKGKRFAFASVFFGAIAGLVHVISNYKRMLPCT